MSRERGGPTPFRRILVATDGSANAERAVEAAIGIAKKLGAKLTIVTVVPVPFLVSVAGPMTPQPDIGPYWESTTKGAEEVVRRAAASARKSGVWVETEVVTKVTSPVRAIAEYARDSEADLIVVGTRGLGGFKKLLLGSVSNGVVSSASCAVLVVR